MRILGFIFALALLGSPQDSRPGENSSVVQTRSTADFLVAAHNVVRAEVGVPPLTWSDSLAQYAQEWANKLVDEKRLYHRAKNSFGENLYLISGGEATPQQVVMAWAAEEADYNWKTNSCRSRCGHYTQLVWRDTKQMGCAMARSGQTEVWVCNYDPPGNYVGERPY